MTAPHYADEWVTLYHGDALDVLRELPDASVDSVVTDPPYGLANTDPAHVAETITRWVNGERDYLPGGAGFMGKAWDAFVPPVAVWDECLRVLKPGGHVLSFAGSRTVDLMTLGLRLAGFEIRDSIAWIYSTGFPKSLDVSKAIDKAAGAEREVVGVNPRAAQQTPKADATSLGAFAGTSPDLTAPATPEAEQWQGWGTALKPAFEPIVVARKPLAGTVAGNVLAHGTGALNIDGCRVEGGERPAREVAPMREEVTYAGTSLAGRVDGSLQSSRAVGTTTAGRWPANVVLDEHTAALVDEQSGDVRSAGKYPTTYSDSGGYGGALGLDTQGPLYDDQGGASRFFYVAKAPQDERVRVPKKALRLRGDLTPEQVDHVRARLAEAGVRVD